MKEDWQVVRTRDLEFTHVRADGSRAGIRDIGITLSRGDRIALIGPSGGRKCTLSGVPAPIIVMAERPVVDAGTVGEILERQPAFREVVYSAAHAAVPPTAPLTVH